MKFTSKYIKLTTSKHRKKYYVLKLGCKIGLFDISISVETNKILKKYFLTHDKVFIDNILFRMFITKIKRKTDKNYTLYTTKDLLIYQIPWFREINLHFIEGSSNCIGYDGYIYLPFKTKSEYLKFKLRTQ